MATIEQPGASYKIHVIGARRQWFGDFYHAMLSFPWSVTLGVIAGGFLAVNLAFAVGYVWMGGIAHARAGSFADAFFFSVQTMATLGYGAMYPQSFGANVLVVAEAVVGLVFTALATGIVFGKFARPLGRLAFAPFVTIAPHEGVPTLMIRVGNARGNQIVGARVDVDFVRTVVTAEGGTFYKTQTLSLLRSRTSALTRSWTVMHPIDGASPLHGATPASLVSDEVELMVNVTGVDDVSYQPVHSRRTYMPDQIVWGARHADILSERADGDMVIDLRNFEKVVPSTATPDFPYPAT